MSPCKSESMCIKEWAKPVMVQRIAPQHSCSTAKLPNQANRHERIGFPALHRHVLPQENTSCNVWSREHSCWKLLRGIQTRFVFPDRHFCWVHHPDLECSAHLSAPRVSAPEPHLSLSICGVRDLPTAQPEAQSQGWGLAWSGFTVKRRMEDLEGEAGARGERTGEGKGGEGGRSKAK